MAATAHPSALVLFLQIAAPEVVELVLARTNLLLVLAQVLGRLSLACPRCTALVCWRAGQAPERLHLCYNWMPASSTLQLLEAACALLREGAGVCTGCRQTRWRARTLVFHFGICPLCLFARHTQSESVDNKEVCYTEIRWHAKVCMHRAIGG
tara:strand:- start:4598 stop:5056 length:459 start_codon:yes stop_codon:yes gene_type:complete